MHYKDYSGSCVRTVTVNHSAAGRQHCSSLRFSDQFEDGPAGVCAAIAAPRYTMRCTGQVCVQTQHCVTYVGLTMHVLCLLFFARAHCGRAVFEKRFVAVVQHLITNNLHHPAAGRSSMFFSGRIGRVRLRRLISV